MKKIKKYGQMDLSDRMAIETGICAKHSFKRIAKEIGRNPTTIANEVKNNRTFIKGVYIGGKDCRNVHHCKQKSMCDADILACLHYCKYCIDFDCRKYCHEYVSVACHKHEKPPYVCNVCINKAKCNKDRYLYSAKYADAAVARRRSETRQGFHLTEEQFKEMDALITKLVRKGQPLTHIYAEHKNELPISLRSMYNYIDSGKMTIRNIDLRRKTGYKRRRGKPKEKLECVDQSYRIGRTYEEFEKDLGTYFAEADVVEMDTVKGKREKGKRLLTMIFRKNSVMLLFLMPDGKAESVKRVFDYLEAGLGRERFERIFHIVLTDNGSEFKRVDDLELNEDYLYRTKIYYCDPMASWQKPHIEKNHEYIWYVLEKSKSFNKYTQEDMTLLMNHINSTKRLSLGNKAPYELIQEHDEDMQALWKMLKMDLIPPDEVHLMPDLFIMNSK